MKQFILPPVLLRGIIPAALTFLLLNPTASMAQSATPDHLVSPQVLQQQVQSASETRQQNIRTVTDFLSTPTAEHAMRDAHYDPVQVRTAIPTLSDQELANLASRSADAQQKFSAGYIGQGLLTLIIICVVIIIIVAIVH
jgi:hypothetical protein